MYKYFFEMQKRRPRHILRSSVQNESRERLLVGVHDRVKPLTPQASTPSWGPARIKFFLELKRNLRRLAVILSIF